jgi:hypothetical protein
MHLPVHIALMQAHITTTFSDLIFDLDDEIGSSDQEDRKHRKVTAPLTVSVGDLFHTVSRPLLAYVSAADENYVFAVIFRAPTTHVFRALDPVFFGPSTKLKAIAQGDFEDHSVSDQIAKLIEASEQMATSRTIRASFRKAEMVLNTSVRPSD